MNNTFRTLQCTFRSIFLTTLVLAIPAAFSFSASAHAANDDVQDDQEATPEEVGEVNWTRDYEAALKTSTDLGKPILMLFQEIPGCQTCKDFGNQPLSHPLIVEAIEDLFVPLLVYNNREGRDAELLKQYGEPSWNNPVVRYLDSFGKDVIEREELVLATEQIAARMVSALTALGKDVPNYLRSAAAPAKTDSLETATFAMHCYWEGEAQLGSIPGVYATRSAWRDNLEVVMLRYNPEEVEYGKLLETAQSFDCASKVFAHSDEQLGVAKASIGEKAVMVAREQKPRVAKESDQKYYLQNSALNHVPLSEFQATKVNGDLKTKADVRRWLSPRQIELLDQIIAVKEKNPNALKDFVAPNDETKLAGFTKALKEKLAELK